jgi:hypothetical protein
MPPFFEGGGGHKKSGRLIMNIKGHNSVKNRSNTMKLKLDMQVFTVKTEPFKYLYPFQRNVQSDRGILLIVPFGRTVKGLKDSLPSI